MSKNNKTYKDEYNLVKARVCLGNSDAIKDFQEHMEEENQLYLRPTMNVIEGVVARELYIPKDTLLIGYTHKNPQINYCLKGQIEITTDEGTRLVKEGQSFVSPAGTKRLGYALEDTIWLTINKTSFEEECDIRKEILDEK